MCYNMITVLEVDYENPWIYEGRPFTSDDIGDTMGSSIASQIPPRDRNTLVENTSCRKKT